MKVKITNNNSTTWEVEVNTFDELLSEMSNPYNATHNRLQFDNGYETTYQFNIYDEDDDRWFDESEYENDFYEEIFENTGLE